MGSRGRLLTGLAVLATAFAVAPTAQALPANDVPASTARAFVPDTFGIGLRQPLVTTDGQTIQGLLVNGSPDDENDPPVVRPPDEFSNCNDAGQSFAYVRYSLWYELAANLVGNPFASRSLVTLDTQGTTFATTLVVFRAALPAMDAQTPPGNVVACDTQQSSIRAAQVSFVAKPNERYFVLVGATNTNSSGGNLTLSGRVLDIESPRVTFDLPSPPDSPTGVHTYKVTANEGELASVEVRQFVASGGERPALARVAPADCENAALRIGQYCVAGATLPTTIRVRWRNPRSSTKETGRVRVTVVDPAGNPADRALSWVLRDRVAPRIRIVGRWQRVRGRSRTYTVRVTCSEAGNVSVYHERGGSLRRVARSGQQPRPNVRLRFRLPGRGRAFVAAVCRDRSGNLSTESWGFFPR